MNCPNCGAPLTGGTCEYCGTLTEVPLSVMLGKKVSIVFEYDGKKLGFDTVIDGLEVNDEGYADSFYGFGGDKVHTIWNPIEGHARAPSGRRQGLRADDGEGIGDDMEMKFKLEGASLPKYAKEGDAGMDLANVGESFRIDPHETVMVHTGVRAEIPDGHYGSVVPRSGIASKRNLAPINAPGTIDSHYRGEILVPLHNFGEKGQYVEKGERVCQLIICPYLKVEPVEADELSETDRGESGFGSSGRS